MKRIPAMSIAAFAAAGGLTLSPAEEKKLEEQLEPLPASPRQQLEQVNKQQDRIGGRRHGYKPHVGAKQKAKAERARIKAMKKSIGL